MSTELLEPPAPHTAANDSADLEAQFNTSLEATRADRGEEEQPDTIRKEKEPSKEAKQEVKASAVDDGIPEEFLKSEKAPEAEPEKDTFLTEEPAKEIKGAAREAFKKLQQAADQKIKAQEQKLADLQKQISERGETQPHSDYEEKVKALSDRAAQLEAQLEKAAYADSPKFKRFGAEEKAEITSAKSYLEGTEINPSVLDLAANASGQQRLKLLRESGMDAETIAAIGPHLARADAIRRDRDSSLENWKANQEREAAEQGTQREANERRQQAAEQEVFKTVGEQMKAKLEGFRRIEGNEKWNALVEQNEKDAEQFFAGKKSLEELAELAYTGVAARTTQMMNAGLRKRLEAVTEENARLKAAQPSAGHSVESKARDGKPLTEKEERENSFNSALASVKGG